MTKRAIVPPAFRTTADQLNMSPAIVANGTIYLTGVTGGDSTGVMSADPQTQIRRVFDKIGAVLREAGLGYDAVVEMTSYHVGLRAHFELFDQIRLEHFTKPYPAWTAVEVAGLRREGVIVEVRVIAMADAGS